MGDAYRYHLHPTAITERRNQRVALLSGLSGMETSALDPESASASPKTSLSPTRSFRTITPVEVRSLSLHSHEYSGMSPVTETSSNYRSAYQTHDALSSSPSPLPRPTITVPSTRTYPRSEATRSYKQRAPSKSRVDKEKQARTARLSAAQEEMEALRARAQALGVNITAQAMAQSRASVAAFLRANRAADSSSPMDDRAQSPVNALVATREESTGDALASTSSSTPREVPQSRSASVEPEKGASPLALPASGDDNVSPSALAASTSSKPALSFFTKVQPVDERTMATLPARRYRSRGRWGKMTNKGLRSAVQLKAAKAQRAFIFDQIVGAAESRYEARRKRRREADVGADDNDARRSESPVAILRRSASFPASLTTQSSASEPSTLSRTSSCHLGERLGIESRGNDTAEAFGCTGSSSHSPEMSLEEGRFDKLSRHAWISPTGTLHLLPSPVPSEAGGDSALLQSKPSSPSPFTARIIRLRRRVNSAASSALDAGASGSPGCPLMDSVMLDVTGEVKNTISAFFREERESSAMEQAQADTPIESEMPTPASDEFVEYNQPNSEPARSDKKVEEEELLFTQPIPSTTTLHSPPRLGRSRRSRNSSARALVGISLGSPVSVQGNKSVRWATDVDSPTESQHRRLSTREHYSQLVHDLLPGSPMATSAEIAQLERFATLSASVEAEAGAATRRRAGLLGCSPLVDRGDEVQIPGEDDKHDRAEGADRSLFSPRRGLLFTRSTVEPRSPENSSHSSAQTTLHAAPTVRSSPAVRGFGRFNMSPLKYTENPFGQSSNGRNSAGPSRRVLSSPSAIAPSDRQKLILQQSPEIELRPAGEEKRGGNLSCRPADQALVVGTAASVSPNTLFGPSIKSQSSNAKQPAASPTWIHHDSTSSSDIASDPIRKVALEVDEVSLGAKREQKAGRKRKDTEEQLKTRADQENESMMSIAGSSTSTIPTSELVSKVQNVAPDATASDWPSALDVPTVTELPRLAHVSETMRPGRKQPDGSRIVKLVSDELVRALLDGKQTEPPERFYTLPAGYGESQERPAISYAALIGQALKASHDGRLGLSEIQAWVASVYPYYTLEDKKWKDSIRHNLTVNGCFIKAEREPDCPGNGGWWSIDPEYVKCFLKDGTYQPLISREEHRRRKLALSGPVPTKSKKGKKTTLPLALRERNDKPALGAEPQASASTDEEKGKQAGETQVQEVPKEVLVQRHAKTKSQGCSSGDERENSAPSMVRSGVKRIKLVSSRTDRQGSEPSQSSSQTSVRPEEPSLRRGKGMSRTRASFSDMDIDSHREGGMSDLYDSDMVTPSRSQWVGYQSSGHGSRGRSRVPPLVDEGSSPPSSPASSMPPPRSTGFESHGPKSRVRSGDGDSGPVESISLLRYGQSLSVQYATLSMQRSPLAGPRGPHRPPRLSDGPVSPIKSSMRGARQRGSQARPSRQTLVSPSRNLTTRSPYSSVRAGSMAVERGDSAVIGADATGPLVRSSGHGRLVSALGMATSPGAVGLGISPLRRSHSMLASSPASSAVMSSPAGARLQLAVDMATGPPAHLQQHVPHVLGGPQWGLGMGMSPARLSCGTPSRFASPSPMRRGHSMGFSNAFSPSPNVSASNSWTAASSGLDDPFDYSATLEHELDFATDMGGLASGDVNASPARGSYGFWGSTNASHGGIER